MVEKVVKRGGFEENRQKILAAHPKLLVLGEPHGTHYLEKLPLIIPFLSKKISCAFIEQPNTLEQSEIDQLLAGENTAHFQTEASFDYVPFLKYLRENNIEIIPVDDRTRSPKGINPVGYMTFRDDQMFSGIMNHIERCQHSLFLVGKHHLTPDISGYEPTLGDRLKKRLGNDVILVDMLAHKNYYEDYCSSSENDLFGNHNALITTRELETVRYSSFVSHSYWSDFDYILFLTRKQNSPLSLSLE